MVHLKAVTCVWGRITDGSDDEDDEEGVGHRQHRVGEGSEDLRYIAALQNGLLNVWNDPSLKILRHKTVHTKSSQNFLMRKAAMTAVRLCGIGKARRSEREDVE